MLVSIQKSASYLGVCRATIYKLISTDQLVSIKIGSRNLIRMDSIEMLISANKVRR